MLIWEEIIFFLRGNEFLNMNFNVKVVDWVVEYFKYFGIFKFLFF